MSNKIIWTFKQVTKNGNTIPRLAGIDLEIFSGITAIIGASGAGKSSLLNLLINFEKPDQGRLTTNIEVDGFLLPLYWVPQNGGLWPHFTVREHLEAIGKTNREEDSQQLLTSFDLTDKIDCYPEILSMGERSRLSIIRALYFNPAVLVMDEPLVNIEPAGRNKYWDTIIARVRKNKNSLVFSSHAPEYVMGVADRVICLKEGKWTYSGTVDNLYWHPPTQETAECLGETNWLTPEDALVWLNEKNPNPVSYRPEQLEIAKVDDSPFAVRNSSFRGAYAETEIEHLPSKKIKLFIHRPAGNYLKTDDKVKMVILPR